jgi:uncharacterized integral membrane protein
MRPLVWSFRLFLFLVLFYFASKNTDPVTLRLFFSTTWQVPLIVLLVAFFAAGTLVGVLAMTFPFFRQWNARRRLARQAGRAEAMAGQAVTAVAPADAPVPGRVTD